MEVEPISNEVVKVSRELIASSMTCPLCDRLFKDATTIPECLHTFCRKCIFKKLTVEEMECCPICKIDLGCVPLEKLRPDHNLQDLRTKLFPYKRKKVEAPDIAPSTAFPLKRKERSLSSLVVDTPSIVAHGGLTGRRSKSARKAAKGSSFLVEKSIKKDKDFIAGHLYRTTTPETPIKFAEKNFTDPSEPLYSTNGTQAKFAQSGSFMPKPLHSTENDGYNSRSKFKKNSQNSNYHDVKNNRDLSTQKSQKPKKLPKVHQKKTSGSGDFNILPQAVLELYSTSIRSEKRMNPIWFSLVASDDQEEDAPLPQISASFLRIKNGNIPVSFIQKYLVRKLDLRSDDEVEIRCMNRAIVPTWQLNHLVDLWLQSTTSERVSAEIGSSAKEFVMVLAYARKVSAP